MPKRPRPNRWADGHTSIDPEDYEIIDDCETIGRIYRRRGGRRSCVALVCLHSRRRQRSASRAPSREEAMAAFK
jgi:hypothetical protein